MALDQGTLGLALTQERLPQRGAVSRWQENKDEDAWVKSQIESGQFGNDSEYIRHLIRQDQQAQERLATLRQALAEGEASGEPKPADMAAIKAAGRKRMKAPEQCSR